MYLNAVYGRYAFDCMTEPEFKFGWGTTYMQYLTMDAFRYDDGNDRVDDSLPIACI